MDMYQERFVMHYRPSPKSLEKVDYQVLFYMDYRRCCQRKWTIRYWTIALITFPELQENVYARLLQNVLLNNKNNI